MDNRDKYGMTHEDWVRLDAMTDEQVSAAALADPDALPITDEQRAHFLRPSPVKTIRQQLRMGRETFAAAYGIPIETLMAWERHHAEPTPAELAYLRVIEREPDVAKKVDFAKAS